MCEDQASSLDRLKAEFLGGVEELLVAGDEGAIFGTAKAPGQRGGELEGVGGFEGKAINQALRSLAEFFGGEHFAPFGPEFVEPHLSACMFAGGELSHAK